jgi:hypothetical protein
MEEGELRQGEMGMNRFHQTRFSIFICPLDRFSGFVARRFPSTGILCGRLAMYWMNHLPNHKGLFHQQRFVICRAISTGAKSQCLLKSRDKSQIVFGGRMKLVCQFKKLHQREPGL